MIKISLCLDPSVACALSLSPVSSLYHSSPSVSLSLSICLLVSLSLFCLSPFISVHQSLSLWLHLSLFLSQSVSICLSFTPSFSLPHFGCLGPSILLCPSLIYISLSLPVFSAGSLSRLLHVLSLVSVSLSVSFSFCPSLPQSVRLSLSLSLILSVTICLSLALSVCLSLAPSLWSLVQLSIPQSVKADTH